MELTCYISCGQIPVLDRMKINKLKLMNDCKIIFISVATYLAAIPLLPT